MTRTDEIAHAREVDTEVARLYGEYQTVKAHVDATVKEIQHAQQYIDGGWDQRGVYDRKIVRLTDDLPALRALAQRALKAATDYDTGHYEGWTRFFLVQHIHNSLHCSSFRPTTRIGWLPDVSGLTEAEAVAEHGATLCTICFPTAPVELTTPKADPTVCTGSGGPYDKDKLTGRERAHFSPAGYCPVCGEWTSLTARFSGKLRKHKISTKGA